MTRKSKARYGMQRTYKLNPTVKALRNALLAGIMAASLAPSVATAAPPFFDVPVNYQGFAGQYVYNYGDVYANAQNIAAAIAAISSGYDASVYNTGNLSVIADAGLYNEFGDFALAAGIYVASAAGDSSVSNYGSATVIANAINDGNADAYGIAVGARYSNVGGYAEVHNEGNINVSANAESGDASASGIYVQAYGDVATYNAGDITVSAYSVFGDAGANGLLADSSDGDAYVYNSGILTISAESIYGSASASGISAEAYDLASVYNTGDISVSAEVTGIYPVLVSTASAIGIDASGYSVSIDNTGNIDAIAVNNVAYGNSIAIGINAEAVTDITISNSGDITLSGSSGDGYAISGYWPNYIYVTGDFNGTGINAESTNGSISVTNSGAITITSLNEDGVAGGFQSGDKLKGIIAETILGDATINNSGDITLTGGETSYGLTARTDSLTVFYDCPPPYDNGYYVCWEPTVGGGDATIINSGDITISVGFEQDYAFGFGLGIAASTGKYGGDAIVQNSGDITVIVTNGSGVGIAAGSTGKYSEGNTFVTNSGDIVVSTTGFSTGIDARSVNDVYVYNSGDITVTTSNIDERASGIYSLSSFESAYINNSGDITALGGIGANGAGSAGNFGATTINSGDISVTSTYFYTMYNSYYGTTDYLGGWANGVFATSRFGGVATVINTGDVEVNALTEGLGLSAFTPYGNANIYNSGDVTVSGQYVSAIGIFSQGSSYDQARSGTLEGSQVINLGDVTATSEVFAMGVQAGQAFDDLLVYNSGNVSATIVNNEGYGNAYGVVALNTYGDVDVINVGDITVASGGQAAGIVASTYGGYFYFYYSGFGSYFNGDVNVISDGALSITSDNARATGVSAKSAYGSVSVTTAGSIDVSAYDRAFGVDGRSSYGYVEITNYADVNVSSSNYNAVGVRALSEYYDATVFNYGDIDVQAAGLAQGIVALSYYGNVGVRNEGDVTASSSGGYSQAVALRSAVGYNAVLRNHGTITAGSGNALAISITGGNGVISNYGDISGSMLTDAGDDYVRNYEGGRIFLTDDSIDLGDGYNYFLNEGRIYANGMNNVINMGYYAEGSGLFVNDGSSIHMDDGAANDALTIIGNFTGNGDVNVDVNGASLSSDRLYIEGDVLSGTANTINVELLRLPSAADILAGETIDIVSVDGASTASNFTLGSVHTTDTALFTTDYSLVYGGGDYALGFEATGLSTAGILLSTVAPAMQNLWFSSLGTMYQRQGGERNFEEGGAQDTQGAAGAWFRLYGSDGSLSPDAKRSNFGAGGSQDFSISTSGIEAGFGYSFNTEWTIGLFGGFNDGSFKPDAGGNVSIDGTTWGGYVTYTPGNGFYADLSYRDISYDGDVLNSGTKASLDGSASGYSLEMGYGFKMSSGLEIEPQLQYSDVNVDLNSFAYSSGGFELTDGDASQLRVGVAARQSFNQDSGVWTPYAALSYVENYSGSNRYLIGGALDGQVDTSGGSMLLELGTDARYGHFMVNAGVGWQNGGAFDSVLTGQVNVRYSW